MVSCSSLYLTLGLAVIFCIMAMTNCTDDNGREISEDKRKFYLGSRYGRSSSPDTRPQRYNVATRGRQFYLGSRYGKRAGELAEPAYEQTEKSSPPRMISCFYTGIQNLYRCNDFEQFNDVINQLSEEDNQSIF